MIQLIDKGIFIENNEIITSPKISKDDAKKNTMAYRILKSHNTTDDMENMSLKVDALVSHDLGHVALNQTAIASGLKKYPIPYILSNCHNSLCAVGGTVNEDDHVFGLSLAKKYGAYFVPPHLAVLHQYMRENHAGGGKIIMGADSHTRYGALGCFGVGEGGGELVKQMLEKTYDVPYPDVVGVKLIGKPRKGIGPMDVALTLIREVFERGFVKNSVLEFFGEGINSLNIEFRNGIDVMTTESACWTTIWETDDQVEEYLKIHNRESDFKAVKLEKTSYYDRAIVIDLTKVESMIALPAHPSNAYTIKELYANLDEICEDTNKKLLKMGVKFDLKSKIKDGKLFAEQGVIGGCSGGTFDNVVDSADILDGKDVDINFNLSVYPSSQPTSINLANQNITAKLMKSGAIIRSAFCGPCFGAGDTPANNQLSIRHNTRNFANREGAKPGEGQTSAVALMDARSIAATAINGGIITPATDLVDVTYTKPEYIFSNDVYKKKVYNYGNVNHPSEDVELVEGPSIKPWPTMPKLTENLLLKVTAYIEDPVTTTDELIPSGETASYRSDPHKISDFTLIRRVPEYVERCKEIREYEYAREKGEELEGLEYVFSKIQSLENHKNLDRKEVGIGSVLYAIKPGDGSAREQAASNQKVLGGWANICQEYATIRYKGNVINWGMLPFTLDETPKFNLHDYIYIENVRTALVEGKTKVKAYVIGDQITEFYLDLKGLDKKERDVILSGSLINYYKEN